MTYKSPIELVYHDVITAFDECIVRAVQRVQIDVDKNELIKALNYDRSQYEKGYADGFKDGEHSWLIRCKDCEYYNADSRSCNAHDCPGDILDPDDYCSWGSRKECADD